MAKIVEHDVGPNKKLKAYSLRIRFALNVVSANCAVDSDDDSNNSLAEELSLHPKYPALSEHLSWIQLPPFEDPAKHYYYMKDVKRIRVQHNLDTSSLAVQVA